MWPLVLQAHAWIMAISWGVMIPLGIVMARNFKELDPFWFKFHRHVLQLAGVCFEGLGAPARFTQPWPGAATCLYATCWRFCSLARAGLS